VSTGSTRHAERDRSHAEGLWPIKVLVVDVEHLPSEISAAHPDGGRYEGLWALVRRKEPPAALLKLPFVNGHLTADELRGHIGRSANGSTDGVLETLEQSLPTISVIVPTMMKRLHHLYLTLESLEALEYPAYEILLVDNRADGCKELPSWLDRFPGVRLLAEPRPGISAARNCGLAAATGELIAFTDDDVTVDPAWLRAIAQRFAAHPEEACVTGFVLPRELETPAQLRLEQYYGGFGPRLLAPVSHRLEPRGPGILPRPALIVELDEAERPLRTFSLYAAGSLGTGANMAFRAAALREVGGFDETLGTGMPSSGGDDLSMFVQLAWRGYSIGFEPAALVHHTHRRDDGSLRGQLEANGLGFTAMLVALAAQDRSHLGAMLATVPRAVRSLGLSYWQKLRPGSSKEQEVEDRSTIAGLARVELSGMARGPAAYWRSRRLVKGLAS